EQDAGDEIEPLLGAGDDEHLVGVTADATSRADMGGNGLAQRPVARGVAITEQARRRVAPAAHPQALPNSEGEGVQGGQAGAERPRDGVAAGDGDGQKMARKALPSAAVSAGGVARSWGRWDRQGFLGQRLADEGARTDAAEKVALGQELLVGGDGRGAR